MGELRFYAITDRHRMGTDPIAPLRALAREHRDRLTIQIREKDLSPKIISRWIEEILPHLSGAMLLVNGRADIARSFPGVGVHLPEDGLSIRDARAVLGPGRPIGASAHSAEDALARRQEGAELVTLSPIFAVPGKGPALGLGQLEKAAPAGGIYALGGIDGSNLREVEQTGVAGIAAIRWFWSRMNP